MTNKTLKIAGLSAVVLASVGAFAVQAAPSMVRASDDACNANPTLQDFKADYWADSVTAATAEYVGRLPLCEGITKTFSLSAYLTEGANWPTSGKQTPVDFATVTLSRDNTIADLKVELSEGDCFYQTDLYANGLRYDGTPGQGAIPHYPDADTPEDAIADRVGGSQVCEPGRGGEEPEQPEVLGESLPKVGGGFSSMLGTLAMAGTSAAYLRSRRSR